MNLKKVSPVLTFKKCYSVEIRERILEKAESLFWRYGVRSITMDDIAREMGISKKTIYQHFTDKDEIVYQAIAYRMQQQRGRIDCHLSAITNPIEQMLRGAAIMRQELATMNPALVIDIQRHHPRAWQMCTEYKDQYILTAIRTNLEQGIESGYYRTDIYPDVMAWLRFEMVQLGFNSPMATEGKLSMVDIQTQILHLFLRGILTDKGFSLYNQYIKQNYNDQASISI